MCKARQWNAGLFFSTYLPIGQHQQGVDRL
jgi:hypothetical protein